MKISFYSNSYINRQNVNTNSAVFVVSWEHWCVCALNLPRRLDKSTKDNMLGMPQYKHAHHAESDVEPTACTRKPTRKEKNHRRSGKRHTKPDQVKLIDAHSLQSNFTSVLQSTGLYQLHPSSCLSSHADSPRSLEPLTDAPARLPRQTENPNKTNTGNDGNALPTRPVARLEGAGKRPSTGQQTTTQPTGNDNTNQQQHCKDSKMALNGPRYTGCRNDKAKPPYSYASLIAQALLAAPNKRLTLASIYAWIMDRYPYYRSENCGWQNSIRHNLSLNECFVRVSKQIADYDSQDHLIQTTTYQQHELGKGAFWTIDESMMDDFEDGMFKRRKYGQGGRGRPSGFLGVDEDYGMSTSAHHRKHKDSRKHSSHGKRKKMTIDDELFKPKQPQHRPMVFAPSPGLSAIFDRGCLLFGRNAEDVDDIEGGGQGGGEYDYTNNEDDWVFCHGHEDPFYPSVEVSHQQVSFLQPSSMSNNPLLVSNNNHVQNNPQHAHNRTLTCPELLDARYVFPMPPTYSDFYNH